MKYTQYLLISADSVERISAAKALIYLTLSSSSRTNRRHFRQLATIREQMTSFIGIHFLTGIPVKIDFYPVAGGQWLLVVSFSGDSDAGTPSAATLPFSPTPSGRRASGMYKFSGASAYKEHTQNLYMSKRGRYYAPPLLPCRGQSGHPWPLDANQ